MSAASAALKLRIDRQHLELMIREFPALAVLEDQLRFGDRVEVPLTQLSSAEVQFLGDLYSQGDAELQTRAAQLWTLQRALNDAGSRYHAEDLERVVPALARYLATDAIRGWLFTASITSRPLPYVLTRLDYTPAANDEAGKVFLEMKANAKGSLSTLSIRITASDIAGKTIGEILAAKGFIKETEALISRYEAVTERYHDWRSRYGEQFLAHGTGYYAQDPAATHRDTDWSRKDLVVLSSSGSPARLVNDEGVLATRTLTLDATGDILGPYLNKAAKSDVFDAEQEARAEQAAMPKGLFTKLPVHPFIFMFHMDLHHYVWVHVEDVQLYAYQPELKQKLVLPPEQTDLIDILTAEMDVLMDDIVAGKSGGTTVLCAGPPGVGKTLTAEVYSEIIKRPLYRVHSGQLGLNVATMETALKDVLTRAQRWGAVMLIDEADVYIRRRDDDMTANAVVGVFLRVLEYFNGLLFMTTNRVDDIDEAIVSRCIALIKFQPPDAAARHRIWEVMCDQFALATGTELINTLVHLFPAATGRDIKGLAKLVAKYCQHKAVTPDLDTFKRCAMFRGMEPVAAGFAVQ